jgi:hypothetical protein
MSELRYGEVYVVNVQALLTDIETLTGNISTKENEFALNAVDFNMGSSQLAPGVNVGNLKKVGAIEYYDSKPFTAYTLTLSEMKAQLDQLISDLAKLLQIKSFNGCKRTLIR